MKYLVLYTYFESEKSIKNLAFFIKNGLFEVDNIYYIFIIKGNILSIKIPNFYNINILKTDNKGYDFGGWADGLNSININDYNYFIFLNDSARGPFLPRYINKIDWVKCFTNIITDEIKLIGSTRNNDHIQSFAFSTDIIGLNILLHQNIFNKDRCIQILKQGKSIFIKEFEINMSKYIINHKYKISGLQLSENKLIPIPIDIHYENAYFGMTINPIEVIFIKSGPGRINDIYLNNYTEWNS